MQVFQVSDFVVWEDHPKSFLDKVCHFLSKKVEVFVGRLVRAPRHGGVVAFPCPRLGGEDHRSAVDTDAGPYTSLKLPNTHSEHLSLDPALS